MGKREHMCTEPGRWSEPPQADAPDDEIRAYLKHCDECLYHATRTWESERWLDDLLKEATRDMPVGPLRSLREDRQPVLSASRTGPRAEISTSAGHRRLARAASVALVAALLVTGTFFVSEWLWDPPQIAEPEVTTPSFDEQARLRARQLVAASEGARAYVARVISASLGGRTSTSGIAYDPEALTAAVADLPFGSLLRVTNPLTGASVEVKVIDRGPEEGAIHLSSAAARALGFEGELTVVVEVVEMPPPVLIGP